MSIQVIRGRYYLKEFSQLEEAQRHMKQLKKSGAPAIFCLPILIKDGETGKELMCHRPRHVWVCFGDGVNSEAVDEVGSSEEYARVVKFSAACRELIQSGLPFRYVTIVDSQNGEVLETFDKGGSALPPEPVEWNFGEE